MNWTALALGAGGVIAVQAAVNSRLGRELGNPALATFISFATGTVCILLYCLLAKITLPASQSVLRVPVWAWCGGLLGAVYVLIVITTTPKLGVGTMVGLTVAGQMLMAVALDHFGMLGLERHPISFGRLAGMALLIAGVVLLKRY
jgi:transporter family-2 protein